MVRIGTGNYGKSFTCINSSLGDVIVGKKKYKSTYVKKGIKVKISDEEVRDIRYKYDVLFMRVSDIHKNHYPQYNQGSLYKIVYRLSRVNVV